MEFQVIFTLDATGPEDAHDQLAKWTVTPGVVLQRIYAPPHELRESPLAIGEDGSVGTALTGPRLDRIEPATVTHQTGPFPMELYGVFPSVQGVLGVTIESPNAMDIADAVERTTSDHLHADFPQPDAEVGEATVTVTLDGQPWTNAVTFSWW